MIVKRLDCIIHKKEHIAVMLAKAVCELCTLESLVNDIETKQGD